MAKLPIISWDFLKEDESGDDCETLEFITNSLAGEKDANTRAEKNEGENATQSEHSRFQSIREIYFQSDLNAVEGDGQNEVNTESFGSEYVHWSNRDKKLSSINNNESNSELPKDHPGQCEENKIQKDESNYFGFLLMELKLPAIKGDPEENSSYAAYQEFISDLEAGDNEVDIFKNINTNQSKRKRRKNKADKRLTESGPVAIKKTKDNEKSWSNGSPVSVENNEEKNMDLKKEIEDRVIKNMSMVQVLPINECLPLIMAKMSANQNEK